jgi:ribosomal protein S8
LCTVLEILENNGYIVKVKYKEAEKWAKNLRVYYQKY